MDNQTTLPGLYTQDGAAEACGVTRQAISRALKEGRLKFELLYGRKIITEAELSRYKAEQGHINGANAKKAEG